MSLPLLVLGVALLLAAIVDAMWTALWVDGGAGLLTSWVMRPAWRGWMALVGPKRRRLLSLLGPAMVALSLLLWLLLLWAGWVLVFASDGEALLNSRTGAPADWADRIYFVAYAISTMGNGDFTPNGNGWQLATTVVTLSGLVLVTLAISYLVSILSAVVGKRSLANQIAGLGGSAEELVRQAWDGRDLRAFDRTLDSLATLLLQVTEQHLAYPILHAYQAADRMRAMPLHVVTLDEALTLMRFAVPPEVRPNPVSLRSARSAVGSYLAILHSTAVSAAEQAPPPPSLRPLREAGIPTVDDGEFAAALDGLRDRRRRLLGLLQHDGWSWADTGAGAPS